MHAVCAGSHVSCECKLRLRLGESVGTQSRRRCGRGEPSPGADVAGVSPVPASGEDVAAVRRGEAYNSSSCRSNACNRHTPCGTPRRAGCHAVWDTMLCGTPCCMGYHARGMAGTTPNAMRRQCRGLMSAAGHARMGGGPVPIAYPIQLPVVRANGVR